MEFWVLCVSFRAEEGQLRWGLCWCQSHIWFWEGAPCKEGLQLAGTQSQLGICQSCSYPGVVWWVGMESEGEVNGEGGWPRRSPETPARAVPSWGHGPAHRQALEPHPIPQWIMTSCKNALNLQTVIIAKLVYCFTLKYKTTLIFHAFWQYKTIKFLVLNGPFHSCLSISTNHVEADKSHCLFYKPFNTKRLTECYWSVMLAGVFSRKPGFIKKRQVNTVYYLFLGSWCQ